MARILPGAGKGTHLLWEGWGWRRAAWSRPASRRDVVTNVKCASARQQRRAAPKAGTPCGTPGWVSRDGTGSRREDGAAGRQCELVQTEGRGWPGRILPGSPVCGEGSCCTGQGQHRDLAPSLGAGGPSPSVGWWISVDGDAGTACQPAATYCSPTKKGPCWAPQRCPALVQAAHLQRS